LFRKHIIVTKKQKEAVEIKYQESKTREFGRLAYNTLLDLKDEDFEPFLL
jgi:hypothetical protein